MNKDKGKDEKVYFNKYIKYKNKYLNFKKTQMKLLYVEQENPLSYDNQYPGHKDVINFNNQYPSDTKIDQWENDHTDVLNELRVEIGREPDFISNKKGGVVIYDYPNEWILKHMLQDEMVEHCVPSKHYDYLYTSVNIAIPADKVMLVQSISGSVLLDLLKNEVTVRCGDTTANYATLRTVVDVIIGNYTREQINELYTKNINNSSTDREKNMAIVKNYVLSNPVKHLAYHPFAFPNGCK